MIVCGMAVKRECEFAKVCGLEDCLVAYDSECADFIAEVIGRLEGVDALEQEYIRMEREAIQKEVEAHG